MAFTQIIVSGKFLHPDASADPVEGTVRFRPSHVMRDASTNQIVARSDVVVHLVNGSFQQVLLATNDITTEPSNVMITYEVYVQLEGGGPEDRFQIVVDAASALGAMDLADVEHLPL